MEITANDKQENHMHLKYILSIAVLCGCDFGMENSFQYGFKVTEKYEKEQIKLYEAAKQSSESVLTSIKKTQSR